MKAVILKERGIKGISFTDTQKPYSENENIMVRLHAASLNQVDIYMRDVGLGIRHSLPQIMGVDGVGEVAEAPDNSNFEIGDTVIIYPYIFCEKCPYCLSGEQQLCNSAQIFGEHCNGTFAEYISVPESSIFPLPVHCDKFAASTLGVAYLTAWRMVFTKGQAGPGKSILIVGGGGGVATAAFDLALMAGCETFVTTTGSEKINKLKSLGAHHVFDYKKANFSRHIKELTKGQGVDIVIDNVGEATWENSLKCIKKGGRIITCGATTGPNPSADLQRLFIRQISIHGSTMGNIKEFQDLLKSFEMNKLSPQIDRIYKLSEFKDAFARLVAPDRLGKVVLDMQ